MSNKERVIRYMEGEMTPAEKKDFEAELLISDDLKGEVNLYRALIKTINEIKDTPADEKYITSIIPRFRLKQSSRPRKKYLPAYAAVTAAVALLLVFINQPPKQVENIKSNTTSVEKIDSVIINLAEFDNNIDSVVANNEEYSAAIDEMLFKELNISERDLDSMYYSTYSGSLQGISEISDEESQIVYDEIINKRFF